VDVTNPIAAPDLSDAQLIVNGNTCATPTPTGGVFGGCGAADPRFQDPQLGRLDAVNGLEWNSFDFPVPGASDGVGGTNPTTTTIRITGIRAKAAQLGGAPGTQITAFVSITGPTTIPITNNVLNVAFPVASPGTTPAPPGPPGVSCVSTSSAPAVDAASSDELLGEVILTCSGGLGPDSPDSTTTVNISASANVDNTNDINFGSGADVVDAVLVVNGNECASPTAVPGSTSCGAPDDRFQDPQYGRRGVSNRVDWEGVVFPIPGAPDGEGGFNPYSTTIRLRNLRGMVSQLGVPSVATFPSTQVTAFISVLNIPATNNVVNIGAPIVGAPSNTSTPDPTLGTTSCVATSVPPVIRAQGITELTGDIVYACTALPPPGGFTSGIAVMDFSTTLNVEVTNNVGFGAGADVTDAVLVVDENNCISPAASGSTFGDCSTPDARYQDPQFGRLVAPNRLEWKNVSFPIPGAPDGNGGTNPGITTIRITGIRSNPTALGIPDAATFPSTQVNAFSTIQGNAVVGITNNVLNIAVPILGLIVTPGDSLSGLQCVDGAGTASVTLEEGFATSFKTTGRATFTTGQTQWESGYYAPGSNNGGGATSGTRFMIRFSDVPDGVTLTVPRQIETASPVLTSDGLQLALVTGTDATGAGGVVTAATGEQTVSLSSGAGFVVYEVLDSNPIMIEDVLVPISTTWAADGDDPPGLGSAMVSATFAPLSDVTTASASLPEPRFVDGSGDPDVFVTIHRCTTTLLFPYVRDQADDTRVTIANPTGLIGGLAPSAGACTLHYHGSLSGGGAPPADQTSTLINPGEVLEFTLAEGNPEQGIAGAPDFTGYLMTICDFQGAAGLAEITASGDQAARALPESVPTDAITPRPMENKQLLFPYAPGLESLRSSIIISNTTEDWLGTTPSSGRCHLGFHGANAPAPTMTSVIPAGEQFEVDVRIWAPDFEGFITADCDFPLARGYSRVFGTAPAAYVFGAEAILQDASVAPLTEEGAPGADSLAGSALLLHGIEDKNTLPTHLEFANYGGAPAACMVQPTTSAGIALAPVPVAVAALSPATLDFDVPGTFTGWMLITCDQSTVEVVARSIATDGDAVTAAFAQNAEHLTAPRTDAQDFVVYPFVEAVEGVDARVSLTNTSLDSLGTTPVSNSCTLSYHGEMAEGSLPPDANLLLAPGEQIEFNLFQGRPTRGIPGALGFRGFLVAACEGPLARGFDYRFTTPEAAAPAVCEVDEFEGIDSRDIRIIRQARGQRVEEGDPRDFDGDGRITLNDRNQCRARCTLPRCAPVQP